MKHTIIGKLVSIQEGVADKGPPSTLCEIKFHPSNDKLVFVVDARIGKKLAKHYLGPVSLTLDFGDGE
jgi:hypothetical protein